jgi:hypothetical protein
MGFRGGAPNFANRLRDDVELVRVVLMMDKGARRRCVKVRSEFGKWRRRTIFLVRIRVLFRRR